MKNIEQIIQGLALNEKIQLLSGYDTWTTRDFAEVPSIMLTDGPHGVRLAIPNSPPYTSYPATVFPVEAAMAATWNVDLIQEAGFTISKECMYYNIGILLGPGLNGKRSPIGGRNFEYYSEDPYLTGKMGVAFVKGLQSGGVGASAKHFVANEQETNRKVVSSIVDERTLREIYLAPFEMVVKEANPWTVMCSYNKVNGTYMSENSIYLKDVLKGEWAFEGLVVSDWWAVNDTVQSIKNGLDLQMPGPNENEDKIYEALSKAIITEKDIDDAVLRILKVTKKVLENKIPNPECNFDENHKISQKVAEEAIVLLKNEKNILPLNRNTDVAVLGRLAEMVHYQGCGSSHMTPMTLEITVDEISKYAKTIYGEGYSVLQDEELIEEAKELAKAKHYVIIFIGTYEDTESEGYDRKDMKLTSEQIRLVEEVHKVNPNIILVLNSGAAIELMEIEKYAKAIVLAWLPGQAGGSAIANVLFGITNPSGKLSETYPKYFENNPSYFEFPGSVEKVTYIEGIFVGYRYYDTKKLDVMYPFGYGLSYTTFKYSNLKLSHSKLSSNMELIVTVDIKNTGKCAGKEIVQVYVKDLEASILVPEKELKGFAKVSLNPKETKTVEIVLDERAFSHYFVEKGKFAVEPGMFEIIVGASSRDIRLTKTLSFIDDEAIT